MPAVTYDEVLRADRGRGTAIRHTPLTRSPFFSEKTGSEVYLKEEFRQKTGSFKIRGAYHRIMSMGAGERRAGVVAASAGNHAQGVAYAASSEGMRCTIVMPTTASPAKVAATAGYGADVVLHGAGYDEAWERAQEIAAEGGATIIHAFDDERVIAAQGVIGLEILRDLPDVEEIYVPVGGGGLAAGVLVAVKETHPGVRVTGVQSTAFPSMVESVRRGERVAVPGGSTIADGISVRRPGEVTLPIVSRLADDVVAVDDTALIRAMFYLMERAKTVVEPAGVAGLAHLLAERPTRGKKAVAVLAGGNVDMYLLGQIVDKGLAATGRLLKVSVVLHDRPGMFRDVVGAITAANANIVEVIHDRLSSGISAGSAGVTMSLETQGPRETEALLSRLRALDLQISVLS